ncbi:hypothetical protein [Microcella alkaliphila]|uniref:hypothetical protein n=1 Tax=Microcella alkaliphila TaxID=279828 RepID=UPI00102A51D5|nr:hypothetical protein [Microcella alkaliphila]
MARPPYRESISGNVTGMTPPVESLRALSGTAATVLAGWNPHETCWFVDAVDVSDAPERWVRDDWGSWTRAK